MKESGMSNKLGNALKQIARPGRASETSKSNPRQPLPRQSADGATESARTNVSATRTGKKVIAGHFDPGVSKALRSLALDRDTSVQALLQEALNDLFLKYSKPPIA
jgi:antitoxin-like ribbon-helix-helix protein